MKASRLWFALSASAAALIWPSGAAAQSPASSTTITEADCTAAKLGDNIPVSAIGEPVSTVTLNAPRWNPAAKNAPAYCSVNGAMAPVDKSPTAKPINFQVAFPSGLERQGRAVRRRRNERDDPGTYRRSGESVRPGLCDLWKRLRPSDRRIRRTWWARRISGRRGSERRTCAWRSQRRRTGTSCGQRSGRAESRRRLGAERRSHQESRLHANEKDARRRDGADRTDVRLQAEVQLLRRVFPGRPRSVDRGRALPERL